MSATAALPSVCVNPHGLVRVLVDEFTPASVAADPADAARLGLVRASDGDYVTPPFVAVGVLASAAGRASGRVHAGLDGFRLGG